jgi:hypothetical protein
LRADQARGRATDGTAAVTRAPPRQIYFDFSGYSAGARTCPRSIITI